MASRKNNELSTNLSVGYDVSSATLLRGSTACRREPETGLGEVTGRPGTPACAHTGTVQAHELSPNKSPHAWVS